MAVSIGKRKRESDPEADGDGLEDEGALRARFQRAFEAKFKPLERIEPISSKADNKISDEEDEGADESDWRGLSDEGEAVVVVHHDSTEYDEQYSRRQDKKEFMSSRPPMLKDGETVATMKQTETSGDDSSEAANLKHDLALQRLLKESQLLDPGSFKGTTAVPEGKSRLKALELRMKDLGAKDSLSQQQKMPLSHRRGIMAKASDREERRRKEAAENGVILERAKARAQVGKRRERSVGGPALGKFKGGTLKLSSRDVRAIEGPRQSSVRGRRGRR